MAETAKACKWSKLFDGMEEVSPPLSAEELLAIPAKRGVFLLAGEGGEPILLATAADIRARVRHRLAQSDQVSRRRADLRDVAARVWWKLATSHFETDGHYLQLARAIYPDTYKALLASQPAWFVHLDLEESIPGFRRRKDVFARPGIYLGPFPDKHAVQRFIDCLIDGFYLCRCEQILRRAPRGRGCMYVQMGRCRAYCDGSASMDDYRKVLAEARDYAIGERGAVRAAIEREMQSLAAARQYERAAACKVRLERLAGLDSDAFSHVADARQFRYILIQPGPGPTKAKVFMVDRGAIRRGATLDYPPKANQLARTISAMESFVAKPRRPGPAQAEGIALTCRYLFGSAQRRGAAIRFDSGLTAEAMAECIESAAALLKLRPPAKPAAKAPLERGSDSP